MPGYKPLILIADDDPAREGGVAYFWGLAPLSPRACRIGAKLVSCLVWQRTCETGH